VRIIPGWGLTADSGGAAWAVYTSELMLGVAVMAIATVQRSRRRSPRRT
jgi:hypothetical protein